MSMCAFGLSVRLSTLAENQQGRVQHSPPLEDLLDTFRGRDLRQEAGLRDQRTERSRNRRL